MNKSLTLKNYEQIISKLLSSGYSCKKFHTVEPKNKEFVLRHDLDMSPSRALKMARLEARMGVYSTYFVLVRTNIYNHLSTENKNAIKEILQLGHEIGLHLDADYYSLNNIDRFAKLESNILEDFHNTKVRVISFHRPQKSLLGSNELIGGRIHTYMPRFFTEMGYCSDSKGQWNDFPFELQNFKDGKALQVLTHPIWWDDKPFNSVTDHLNIFAKDKNRILKQDLKDNCVTYKPNLED